MSFGGHNSISNTWERCTFPCNLSILCWGFRFTSLMCAWVQIYFVIKSKINSNLDVYNRPPWSPDCLITSLSSIFQSAITVFSDQLTVIPLGQMFSTYLIFNKVYCNIATSIYLCTIYCCFHTTIANLPSCNRDYSWQNLKYLLFSPLPKKFANHFFRTWEVWHVFPLVFCTMWVEKSY